MILREKDGALLWQNVGALFTAVDFVEFQFRPTENGASMGALHQVELSCFELDFEFVFAGFCNDFTNREDCCVAHPKCIWTTKTCEFNTLGPFFGCKGEFGPPVTQPPIIRTTSVRHDDAFKNQTENTRTAGNSDNEMPSSPPIDNQNQGNVGDVQGPVFFATENGPESTSDKSLLYILLAVIFGLCVLSSVGACIVFVFLRKSRRKRHPVPAAHQLFSEISMHNDDGYSIGNVPAQRARVHEDWQGYDVGNMET